jgi:arylsulfatase A-like enzyme
VCEDLFATVAAACGVAVAHDIDGHDLAPYLRGLPGTHRPQEWIVHFPHGHNDDHFTVYRRGPFKLIHSYGPRTWELYDLATDGAEETNLAAERPDLSRALARRMLDELDSLDAQLPLDAETGEPVRPAVETLEPKR